MEKSTLKPFLRDGLDVLFIGVNPAKGSSRKGHYFSVNAAFWNQLFDSGLIVERVDKNVADEIVFGSNRVNRAGLNYGVTDLVPKWAESASSKITPSNEDCRALVKSIKRHKPKVAVLLHSKVRRALEAHLKVLTDVEYGQLGRIIPGLATEFFSVPFPHGNAITTETKVGKYREIVRFLPHRSRAR